MLWIIFFVLLGMTVLGLIGLGISHVFEKQGLLVVSALIFGIFSKILGLYVTVLLVVWILKLIGVI